MIAAVLAMGATVLWAESDIDPGWYEEAIDSILVPESMLLCDSSNVLAGEVHQASATPASQWHSSFTLEW